MTSLVYVLFDRFPVEKLNFPTIRGALIFESAEDLDLACIWS